MVDALVTSIPLLPPTRVRLGERPSWWDATCDAAAFADWREASARAALPVDAYVAVLVELDLVLDDLAPFTPNAELLLGEAVAEASGVRRLDVRRACSPTFAVASDSDDDELPELVLPQRLTTQLRIGQPLAPRVVPSRISLARAADACAAHQGRTLEAWALLAALRAR